MDPLDELITWAAAKGVKLNGIKPARMPGRGVGVVATRQIAVSFISPSCLPSLLPSPPPLSSPNIIVTHRTYSHHQKPGEVLLEVPTTCLRTTDTVPKALELKLPRSISVHGLLAADLALSLDLDPTEDHQAPWNAVCPTPADFATMPLQWPAELQALLPGPPAREMLAKQQAKLARDWADASAAFAVPGNGDEDDDADDDDETPSPEDHYRYAWLLVNTRTFYWYAAGTSSRGSKGRPKRRKVRPTDADSCMCLQPVADLFNHGDDEACGVAFDDDGYAVRAARAFALGEEVRISYGRHPGDFLLVEYGFAMADGNRWDEVALDDVLLPRFSAEQRALLEEVGFLGRYVLDCNFDVGSPSDGEVVCYRTQVAVRLLCCGDGVAEWRRFVDGVDDGEATQGMVDELLEEVLEEYKGKAEKRIREIEGLKGVGEPEQRAVLTKRWKQIRDLLAANIARLQERYGDSE